MKLGSMWTSGLLMLVCAVYVFSADIYVAPTGNDAAAGTLAAPLATVKAARDKADQLKAGNIAVTVYLRGGTYYLDTTVVFGAANSGTATAPIVYTAYNSEKPVISGGIKVTSAWAASTKANVMVTTIKTGLKVDQLFLNGKRQVLARYPNFNANTVILNGYAADCMSAARVGSWANPGEGPGYFRGIDGNSWGGSSYFITGKNGTTATTTWVGDNNRVPGVDATKRLVENIYEELDAAGEWFYRKSTGQLFFYPPAGTDLSTATIELASQDELFRFVGSASGTAGSVKYIQINGLTLTHTYRTLFSKPYENVQASDWAIARSATVFMQNAENIKISNCNFDQIGGNGVFCSGYNRSHIIYNNVFTDAGASCVVLMGLHNSVRCPAASYGNMGNCTDKTNAGPVDPVNGEFPEFVTVDNNMMVNLGRFEKQPAGIALSATQCDTLRHNTIHDCPRAGICFCDCSWGGHVVEFNWIYNAIQETGDHGPLNSWGRDRNWRWQNDVTTAKLDAWKTTIIRNNRFESHDLYFGIDMDDGASNYLQYNNLLFGGGLKLQWNAYNTYLNNILVAQASVQFHGTWTNSHHYGARNVLMGNAIYGNCCFSGDVPSSAHAAITQWDSNCVYNNINPSIQPYMAPWGGTNQQFSWTQWKAGGCDAHSVVADPLFTDTNKTTWASWPTRTDGFKYMPKGDYTLRAGSPALAMGFKNFPMDSFGVMPPPSTAVQAPAQYGAVDGHGAAIGFFKAGQLIVLENGPYQLTITTALGRTVEVYNGKGRTSFNLPHQSYGAGVYFAVVRSANRTGTFQFLIN